MEVIETTGGFRPLAEAAFDRFDWGAIRFACSPSSTGARQLAVLEAVFAPGGGHAFHRHPEQEELLYVVSGRIEQWVDREMRILGPGDSAFLPAGVVHASHNALDGESRVLAIFGPCVGDGFASEELADVEPWSTLRAR
jgi:quercetin dioxygenase-like cupin family protein